jgi:hypothetical protein
MSAYGPERGLDTAEAAALVLGKHHGWSAERVAREVAQYRAIVERLLPRPQPTKPMLATAPVAVEM